MSPGRQGLAGALAAVGLAFALAGCAGRPAPPELRAEPLALVISTDMGADDMVALLALAARPDVELRGVAVSGAGLATCAGGVPNARALLALAGRPEVPVACGREEPLQGGRAFPAEWRAAADGAFGVALPAAPGAGADIDAAGLIVAAAAGGGDRATLLALGPLTDVADALGREPGLAEALAGVIWMGGALDVPGNLGPAVDNPAAEWNSYLDPHAAGLVLSSGVPVALVPLDATDDAPVTPGFLRRLGGDRGAPPAAAAYDLLEANRGQIERGQLFFWDAVAAALALDPSLARWEPRRLRVVAGGHQSGALLADEAGARLQAAVGLDRARFEGLLLDTLNGRYAAREAQ